MFSNRICIFTLFVATVYHLGITAQQKGNLVLIWGKLEIQNVKIQDGGLNW